MNRLMALLMALAASLPAWAGEAVNQQLDAAANGKVEIDALRGKISVAGWDQNVVSIKGTRDDASDEFSVSRQRDLITIEDNVSHGDFDGNEQGTNLVVMVPRSSSLSISVVAANLDAQDINGKVRLETVSGNVTATNLGDDVRLESVSGNVTAQVHASRLSAESVSGDVEVHNGGVLADGELSTVSGDVTLRSAIDDAGDVSLESVSGDITVVLRGEINVRINAETGPGGDIENGLNAEQPVEDRYIGADSLELELGNGGAEINASVVSGTIRFTKE